MKIFRMTAERSLAESADTDQVHRSSEDSPAWIDIALTDETESDVRRVFENLDLHPLALENALAPDVSPAFSMYPGCLFLRIPCQHAWDDHSPHQLVIICTREAMITVHRIAIPALENFEAAFTGPLRFQTSTTAGLFYSLIDLLADDYLAFSRASRKALEALEQAVANEQEERFLEAGHLKGMVNHLEDNLEDVRLALSKVEHVETAYFSLEELRIYYADVLAHLDYAIGSIERQQRHLAELHKRHTLMIQDKTNRRLRILTILSAIFMPLTLLAGIYGMNFRHMPELGWTFGYPGALSAMALIASLLVWNFHHRGWFD